MKLSATMLSAMLLLCTGVMAQSKLTIDQVYKVSQRNSGPIVENEQVKGYYSLFISDKVDKKTNEYTLQLIDENLNKLKTITFTDSKDVGLIESSYNGSALTFLFYNEKENTLEYRLYGMDGKAGFTYSKVLDKKSEEYFKQQWAFSVAEESENKNVFDIKKKGFICVTPLVESKKKTYEINFYSSEKKRSWAYNPIEDGKFTSAEYLGSNDSIAIFEILSKEKLSSKNMESTVLGLNLETGRKVFEIRTQDGKNQLYPMNISTLNGMNEFLLIGLYYEGGDRMMRDKSEGLGIWMMNNQGKIIKSKYMSWAQDMTRFVKMDHKGRLGDLGYLYIHKLMQTEDGKIFAIGEGYKKVADGLGIAANIISASYRNGMTKLQITDMVLLEMTKDFELKNATIYEKKNSSFSLRTASDFATPHTLAVVAKSLGSFDYIFSQMGKNNSTFTSAYYDYERTKEYKGFTFNSISYFDGKISTDKINLKSDASMKWVMPAKPGFVLLTEYFKKEKRLEFRMEKLN